MRAGSRSPPLTAVQPVEAASTSMGAALGLGLQQGPLYGAGLGATLGRPGLAGVLGAPRLLFPLLPLGALRLRAREGAQNRADNPNPALRPPVPSNLLIPAILGVPSEPCPNLRDPKYPP